MDNKTLERTWKDFARALCAGVIFAILCAVAAPLLLRTADNVWGRWLYAILVAAATALVVRLRYLMHLLK